MRVASLFLGALILVGEGVSGGALGRYPNELDGFKFQASAKWGSLVPLKSTIAEVRALLGQPRESTDLSDYFSPYPGDERAGAPLLEYSWRPEWDVYIYFVTRDEAGRPGQTHGLGGRVRSIELIPRKRPSFAKVVFPSTFVKHHVIAADAAWDEYSDAWGLTYAVYSGRPAHVDASRGDLNRIIYGAPHVPDTETEVM
jgi:hypothetical protein